MKIRPLKTGIQPAIMTYSLFLVLTVISTIQAQSTNLDKRGLLYIGSNTPADYNTFLSAQSPMTWYYTFSTWPALQSRTNLQFVSMIHGLDNLNRDMAALQSLPKGPNTYILVFNEPDGTVSSGGSSITPEAAAQAYINTISVLRSPPYNFRLSVPATTGSSNGLNWLQNFNRSCYALRPTQGCVFDFVAAHWYGDFPSMASWLGTLHVMYPTLPVWLTEFALPQANEDVTYDMLNQSLPFLDRLEYLEKYAWFGAFRTTNANGWTGPGVSFWDANGGLTKVGAMFLGGEVRGFSVGQKGGASRVLAFRSGGWWWTLLSPLVVVLFAIYNFDVD